MKTIYIPNESFVDSNDVKVANKLLSRLADNLLDEIDDNIEVWIIGNKDKDFFNKQINIPMKKQRVLDPFDQLPISDFRQLHHVSIVILKIDRTDIVKEYYYGNTDYNITDFITALIKRLGNQFPKNKVNIKNNRQEDKYIKEQNRHC